MSVVRTTLADINGQFREVIYRPLTIMFGDAIQCVLNSPDIAFDIFQQLEEKLWLSGTEKFGKKMPILLRCGIGIGKISNPSAEIGAMTGEAFVFARKALDIIKREHRKSTARIVSSDDSLNEEFNLLVELICALKSKWTFSQRKVVTEYRKNQRQEEISKTLDVTPPYVSKVIEDTKIKVIMQGEEYIRKIIKNRYITG